MFLTISTISLLLWVASLKYAEHRNRELKFHKDVISDYISTSRYLQIGFLFLTLGLGLFGHLVKDISSFASYCFYLGAAGSFIVAATRSEKVYNTKGTRHDWWHILGAGLAFVVTSLGILVLSWGRSGFLMGFAVSIPLYSALGFRYKMDDGDKERIVAYPLIIWFLINALTSWTVF